MYVQNQLPLLHPDHFTASDFLCGFGGVSQGFEEAEVEGMKIFEVEECVNHDPMAIICHKANHPRAKHWTEDMRKVNENGLKKTKWGHFSLECQHFSGAKGGQSRDPDSRSLADDATRYIKAQGWDYVSIENVREFRDWGPLEPKVAKDGLSCPLNAKKVKEDILDADGNPAYTKNGKVKQRWKKLPDGKFFYQLTPIMVPIKERKGEDFRRWVAEIEALGYHYEMRMINAADLGAYTSRNRLIIIFAKIGLPIAWPEQTHSKGGKKPGTLKHKAVRDCLDFSDEGKSIFRRKLDKKTGKYVYVYSKKTYERLDAGCIRHIAGGKTAHENFLMQIYGADSTGHNTYTTDRPARTITTADGHVLVRIEKSHFIAKHYSGDPYDKNISIEGPAGTITTADSQSLITAERIPFITQYNSGDDYLRNKSVDEALGVITTENRFGLVQASFLHKHYGSAANHQGVNIPAGTVTTKDRFSLVNAHFIHKQYNSDLNHSSVEEPSRALTQNPKGDLVTAQYFIERQFSQGKQHESVDGPAGAITTVPKMRLVTAEPLEGGFILQTQFNNVGSGLDQPAPTLTASRHHHYIVNPTWGGNSGSTDEPLHTIVARQDKAPLSLVSAETGEGYIVIYDDDPEYIIRLKEFMAMYGIVDIKMRMLKVAELLKIQGFPANYKLIGSQTLQKKFIGNSVVPELMKRIAIANFTAYREYKKIQYHLAA